MNETRDHKKPLIENFSSKSITDTQFFYTYLAYLNHAPKYAFGYEFVCGMVERTDGDYLADFENRVKMVSDSPNVIVLGAGNGADTLRLIKAGCTVLAVDYSSSMADKLNWYKTGGSENAHEHSDKQSLEVVIEDVRKLNDSSYEGKFDGVLVDSCFQHLNLPDILAFYQKAFAWLKPGGVIHARFKLTEDGTAYGVHHPELGTRYYTSLTKEGVVELGRRLQEMGYQLSAEFRDFKISPHKDAQNGMPPFIMLPVTKPSS